MAGRLRVQDVEGGGEGGGGKTRRKTPWGHKRLLRSKAKTKELPGLEHRTGKGRVLGCK